MRRRLPYWKSVLATLALVACVAGPFQPAADQKNLADNGGFESGENGWMWQQWHGAPLPGFVDREDRHEGLKSFKFHQDGVEQSLYMARIVELPAEQDYVLSLALKADGMPKGAARVRVLIDGQGWYGRETGHMDLVRTGGTHGWKTFAVPLAASALGDAGKVTVYVLHDRPDRGTLGIDSVAVKPAPAQGRSVLSGLGIPKTVTYSTGSPMALLKPAGARVAIQASPDRALYRKGKLPRVVVSGAGAPGVTLAYRVVDGFGRILSQKAIAAAAAAELPVELPPGHGYYEVVAELKKGGRVLGEARRSIGALAPPAPPVGDEPFGLWIQGTEYYPELGVRWARDGVSWQGYRAGGDKYLEGRKKQYRWFHEHNIKVIAYPKHPHPHQISREVIADTPEAWRSLREWWTRIVRELAGHVDAWGVINEPMRGHWEGSDELIVRYWALMREIVDRHDPGTPLIGPSLSPNTPSLVEQYRDLLDLGFGRYIDAVEMHTYATSDDDWIENARRLREITRQATGRDLPVWSTEHGTGGTYPNELHQAQGLLRAWLVARKIGYPVVIWHMFSYPQGSDKREVGFGIFRNTLRTGEAPPQPRPAGVAYGVTTRQLAGAVYRRELDHLGPAINAYVFERNGRAMVALWTTSTKSYEVTLPVGEERNVTATGLFGRVDPLAVEDGLVRVTVDRNPRIVAPLPRFLLAGKPVASLDKPIEALPGQAAQATLTLANPVAKPAKLRIDWRSPDGWRLTSDKDEWPLEPLQRKTAPLTATAPRDLAIGDYQVYAKIYLNGRYLTTEAVRASVLPRITLGDVHPGFDGDRAVLAGTLRRLDRTQDAAAVELADGRSERLSVRFGKRDEASFALPVRDPASGRLEDLELVVHGEGGGVQERQRLRLSFVPVTRMRQPPKVDGQLDDWPAGGAGGASNVQWGWDETHLFLAVRVADEKHVQDGPLTEMWQQDSLQIGIAPGAAAQLVRAYLPGLQEAEMMEFDLALRGDGPSLYRHRTMNKHLAPAGPVGPSQIRAAVRHADGTTRYELSIPVEQLGLKRLAGGQVLRAALLFNDSDGRGRRSTEWFGGILEAKDPELFGHLYLRD